VVECAGLEIRYTVLPYRGFESLLLRQSDSSDCFTSSHAPAPALGFPGIVVFLHLLTYHPRATAAQTALTTATTDRTNATAALAAANAAVVNKQAQADAAVNLTLDQILELAGELGDLQQLAIQAQALLTTANAAVTLRTTNLGVANNNITNHITAQNANLARLVTAGWTVTQI